MANANAIVEKLKDVGLRHGEKAGVAIASTLFFFCIGLAAKKETINTDPGEDQGGDEGLREQFEPPRGHGEDHPEPGSDEDQGQSISPRTSMSR